MATFLNKIKLGSMLVSCVFDLEPIFHTTLCPLEVLINILFLPLFVTKFLFMAAQARWYWVSCPKNSPSTISILLQWSYHVPPERDWRHLPVASSLPRSLTSYPLKRVKRSGAEVSFRCISHEECESLERSLISVRVLALSYSRTAESHKSLPGRSCSIMPSFKTVV